MISDDLIFIEFRSRYILEHSSPRVKYIKLYFEEEKVEVTFWGHFSSSVEISWDTLDEDMPIFGRSTMKMLF